MVLRKRVVLYFNGGLPQEGLVVNSEERQKRKSGLRMSSHVLGNCIRNKKRRKRLQTLVRAKSRFGVDNRKGSVRYV